MSELIVKFFHGDFTPQGFKRYSGLWKGPPPGNIGKKDLATTTVAALGSWHKGNPFEKAAEISKDDAKNIET